MGINIKLLGDIGLWLSIRIIGISRIMLFTGFVNEFDSDYQKESFDIGIK